MNSCTGIIPTLAMGRPNECQSFFFLFLFLLELRNLIGRNLANGLSKKIKYQNGYKMQDTSMQCGRMEQEQVQSLGYIFEGSRRHVMSSEAGPAGRVPGLKKKDFAGKGRGRQKKAGQGGGLSRSAEWYILLGTWRETGCRVGGVFLHGNEIVRSVRRDWRQGGCTG